MGKGSSGANRRMTILVVRLFSFCGGDVERKTVGFQLTALDTEGRTLEGYASIFGNLDLGDDIIHPGAFAKTLAERGGKVRFLWQHDPSEPLGKPIELHEDARGLFFKAVISDTARGRDALALLRDGAIEGLSIGYESIKGGTDFENVNGRTVRHLREVRLHEISLVSFPMNESAGVTALKTATPYHGDLPLADRERPWDSGEALGRVRALAGVDGDNPDWRLFARAFLWHDEEAPENLTSYKLPYCDVIGGELTAVPRGIFAAAGGRGVLQADIPEADRERVVATINRWYTRMAREFEDDTIVSPLLKAVEDAPQVKSGRVLSQASADKIRAAIQALSDLLEVAFPPEPETESAEDDTKQAALADAASAIVPPDTEAAPSQDTHLDAKRTELEQELQRLALTLSMEV